MQLDAAETPGPRWNDAARHHVRDADAAVGKFAATRDAGSASG
jgi:hypothetical protein